MDMNWFGKIFFSQKKQLGNIDLALFRKTIKDICNNACDTSNPYLVKLLEIQDSNGNNLLHGMAWMDEQEFRDSFAGIEKKITQPELILNLLNRENKNRKRPLEEALASNNPIVVKKYVKKGASCGLNDLNQSIKAGTPELVKSLLSQLKTEEKIKEFFSGHMGSSEFVNNSSDESDARSEFNSWVQLILSQYHTINKGKIFKVIFEKIPNTWKTWDEQELFQLINIVLCSKRFSDLNDLLPREQYNASTLYRVLFSGNALRGELQEETFEKLVGLMVWLAGRSAWCSVLKLLAYLDDKYLQQDSTKSNAINVLDDQGQSFLGYAAKDVQRKIVFKILAWPGIKLAYPPYQSPLFDLKSISTALLNSAGQSGKAQDANSIKEHFNKVCENFKEDLQKLIHDVENLEYTAYQQVHRKASIWFRFWVWLSNKLFFRLKRYCSDVSRKIKECTSYLEVEDVLNKVCFSTSHSRILTSEESEFFSQEILSLCKKFKARPQERGNIIVRKDDITKELANGRMRINSSNDLDSTDAYGEQPINNVIKLNDDGRVQIDSSDDLNSTYAYGGQLINNVTKLNNDRRIQINSSDDLNFHAHREQQQASGKHTSRNSKVVLARNINDLECDVQSHSSDSVSVFNAKNKGNGNASTSSSSNTSELNQLLVSSNVARRERAGQISALPTRSGILGSESWGYRQQYGGSVTSNDLVLNSRPTTNTGSVRVKELSLPEEENIDFHQLNNEGQENSGANPTDSNAIFSSERSSAFLEDRLPSLQTVSTGLAYKRGINDFDHGPDSALSSASQVYHQQNSSSFASVTSNNLVVNNHPETNADSVKVSLTVPAPEAPPLPLGGIMNNGPKKPSTLVARGVITDNLLKARKETLKKPRLIEKPIEEGSLHTVLSKRLENIRNKVSPDESDESNTWASEDEATQVMMLS